MGFPKRATELQDDIEKLGERRFGAATLPPSVEVLALQELHGEIIESGSADLHGSDIEDPDDIGVDELARDADFAFETLDKIFILDEARTQELQRNRLIELPS
jgi:hypothetical protein